MLIAKNKWLLFIISLYFILAVNYAINVPIFESPDEPDHFLYVKYIIKYQRLPLLEDNNPESPRTAIHPPLYYLLSAVIYAPFQAYDHPVEHKYNEKFGLINRNRYFHKDENMREHYPFYIIRLFSILLGMLTIIFGWKTANEIFGESQYLIIGSTALIAFIPQFIYISSSVNNDNLANFISSVIFWILIRMAKSDFLNKKELVFLGAGLGFAAITKFTALFLIPFAILALYIIQKDKKEYIKNVIFICALTGIISGWYYFRNYIMYDYALGGNFGSKRGIFSSYFIKPFANMMLLSFFGLFGWMNIVMARILSYLYIIFYGIGFLSALIFISVKASLINKYKKVKLCYWILFSGIILSLISNIRYNMTNDDYQGRHMLTIIAPFAILTVAGYNYIYTGIKDKYQLLTREKTKTLSMFLLIIFLFYMNIFIVNAYIKPSFAGAFL